MAINIVPGFRLQARILALLQARPMMSIELAARLDYPYATIKAALAQMLAEGQVKRIGQRYALVSSEADNGPDAA